MACKFVHSTSFKGKIVFLVHCSCKPTLYARSFRKRFFMYMYRHAVNHPHTNIIISRFSIPLVLKRAEKFWKSVSVVFFFFSLRTSAGLTMMIFCLYPRHLCWGVYSLRLSIHKFIRTSVPFVELLQSFTVKQLEWSISHQPLIRKHSYLDHRYPGASAFIPWLLTPGSMPRGGARGQNLGHL